MEGKKESQGYSDHIRMAHENKCAILPNGEMVSLNTHETRRNNNILVIGGSGSGKTRSIVTPNLLAATGSYIVSDPKGNLYAQWSDDFRRVGYRVVHLDFIHPERSDHYNPLFYVNNSNDVQKLAHQIVFSDGGRSGTGGSYDPFWDRAAELLLSAILGYIMEQKELGSCGNFNDISKIITEIDAERWEDGGDCEIDGRFRRLSVQFSEETGRDSWAYQQFLKFRQTPKRTMGTIILTVQTMLGRLDTAEIRGMLDCDEVQLPSIGEKKTIVFVEISDTDRSKDILANIFYSQAMNQLCTFADECCVGNRLPVPVRFILDDFATNCKIDGFENMISNIRSREISTLIILQSQAQLAAGYGSSAHTIVDNCDTLIYMGGNDPETASMVAARCNKPLNRMLNMEIGTNWIIRRGELPRYSKTVDLDEYSKKGTRKKSAQAVLRS